MTLCNATITFSDGRSVVIEHLDEAQAAQLSALLQASGVWYRWNGSYYQQQTLGARLSELWRRVAAWAMPLLLIAALSVPVMAQDRLKARAVEPVRVSVTALGADRYDKELAEAFRSELRKLRYVEISGRQSEWNVFLTMTPITESGSCPGYAAAILIVGKRAQPVMSIYTAERAQLLARHLAAKLEKVFQSNIKEGRPWR